MSARPFLAAACSAGLAVATIYALRSGFEGETLAPGPVQEIPFEQKTFSRIATDLSEGRRFLLKNSSRARSNALEASTLGPMDARSKAEFGRDITRLFKNHENAQIEIWRAFDRGEVDEQTAIERDFRRERLKQTYLAALELLAADGYWTLPPRGTIPMAPEGVIYQRWPSALVKGQSAKVVFPIEIRKHPALQRAVVSERRLKEESLIGFIAKWNARPITERKRLALEHLEAKASMKKLYKKLTWTEDDTALAERLESAAFRIPRLAVLEQTAYTLQMPRRRSR